MFIDRVAISMDGAKGAFLFLGLIDFRRASVYLIAQEASQVNKQGLSVRGGEKESHLAV